MDILPPTLELISPTDSSTISGVVDFKINAQPGTNPLVSGFISIDESFAVRFSPVVDSIYVDTTKYPNGTYLVNVKVFDFDITDSAQTGLGAFVQINLVVNN